MIDSVNTLPNHNCPLCGGPNACALAKSGDAASPCWCREVVIDPAAIARLTEGQRNTVCLCARCAVARPMAIA